MEKIARIHTDMPDKFGIPRQSGIVKELTGTIVFEPKYRNAEALNGIEDFSHLWLIWQFSENIREGFSPTVRPPRLGGEKRKGVFSTRSPFRPNNIGLSCVKLEEVRHTKNDGTVLVVSGVDMMDGTPIYDIKPYIAYSDCIPDAVSGFADDYKDYHLEVCFEKGLLDIIASEKQNALIGILRHDPRPAYHDDCNRIYGVKFAGYDVRFKVNGNKLTVCEIERI